MAISPHPGLIWRPASTFGYELTIHGFSEPLGRAVQMANGKWRTIARAPGRERQGATAGSLAQRRMAVPNHVREVWTLGRGGTSATGV